MSRAPTRPGVVTVGALLAGAAGRLAEARVESARLDARLIVGMALGLDAAALLARRDDAVDALAAQRVAELLGRRERREPMSHILGEREFWSLPFRVTAATLTPRPDSETLIEAALAWAAARDYPGGAGLHVLDFGTGTGCLLLALLSEWPAAAGTGVDISPAALAVARDNARALGLAGRARFLAGDWGCDLAERFQVIVANPPYIADGDLDRLDPEVARYEPRLALAGGADGLAAYRALAPHVRRLLADDGAAFLEIGQGQAVEVTAILAETGLRVVTFMADLGGTPRCLVVIRQRPEKY
ncbi:peptide chain release factor N(5)-glutamine methyltransferase [Shumkonia mesophila]|uniref:peptide chain release factor N(5)-glutamine methyltransferase n=1 Tax=Shumkonia mesophila TaxID=2838854 RepID=UPI0029344736|nr:peptide chain release factor N(5)-glutamine methyltransferase [Shumkonia mesophila]